MWNLQCLTSSRGVNAGLSAYLQLILAVWPLWGGRASAMITVSCGGIIPQSRATEMAVSMLSPWRSHRQSKLDREKGTEDCTLGNLYISMYTTSFCLSVFTVLVKCMCSSVDILPVTMTVRMCAFWRSCRTPAVSAFSLFCMIIRPRKSILASMWSLVQRGNNHNNKNIICSCSLWPLAETRRRNSKVESKWPPHKLPVYILDFVPGQFGFKPTVSQGYDSESLLGVAFQNLWKIPRHCMRDTNKSLQTSTGSAVHLT